MALDRVVTALDLSDREGWEGFRIDGDKIFAPNGESYSSRELQSLRAQINNWRRLARVQLRELRESKREGAVVFELEELSAIRRALALLDAKLPGQQLTWSTQNVR